MLDSQNLGFLKYDSFEGLYHDRTLRIIENKSFIIVVLAVLILLNFFKCFVMTG